MPLKISHNGKVYFAVVAISQPRKGKKASTVLKGAALSKAAAK